MNYLPRINRSGTLQSGQALLIILLSMSAILTVVLSVASRSVTDISVTTSEEDALRAFSAAEAGVEKALMTGSGGIGSPDPSDTSSQFDTVVDNASTEGSYFVYPAALQAGDTATFWFVGRDENGNFDCSAGQCKNINLIKNLCWGANPPYTSNSEKPAILLSVYYDLSEEYLNGVYSNIQVARKGFDPVTSRDNNFVAASGGNCTLGNTNFNFSKTDIQLNPSDMNIPGSCGAGCLIMARVRLFYNSDTKPDFIGMEIAGGGGDPFPPQGKQIESTGTSGDSTRKVNVFQSFSEPPNIFDAAVFSYSNFSKI